MRGIKKLLLCFLAVLTVLTVTVLGNGVVNAGTPKEKKQAQPLTNEQLDRWDAPDRDYLEFFGLPVFTTTLPVIYINTQGQQIGKENKIECSIALGVDDGKPHSIEAMPQALYRARINYRGASSYSKFDKKQYRIKFLKDHSDKAQNVALCGMGKNSEWVLNGPYLDKTLVRNKLIYDLARETGQWAPDSRFCELFVDGEYHGVYLAIEPVTNGDSRLRLSKFGLVSGKTPYLVERNRDSLVVDYFIINEFAMIRDAGNLSTYAYKKMEGKLQLACWDFNNGFDNYPEYVLDGTGFETINNSWLDRVSQDPVFIDRVVERYRQLRETTLSQEHIDELLKSYHDQLGEAIDRNFQIWGGSFDDNILVGKNAQGQSRDIRSYDEAMEQLNTMIRKRLEFLDEHFVDLYDCTEGR